MSLLFINQFFWPDAAATSQLLTDLACHLAGEGHEVRVICADGYYAPDASVPAPPVAIRRIPALPFARNSAGRIASYASFLGMAGAYGLGGPRPHTVVTLTTPPALSLIGSLIRSLRGSRHFIWEMDLYPDIAVDLKVLSPTGPVTRSMAWALTAARRRCHGIIALGEDMKDRLAAQGIDPEKISVCDNWADGKAIVPLPFPDSPLTIHYSGNLGLAHDVETIRAVMRHFRHDSRFRFVFAGGGALRPALESWCLAAGIAGASFEPYSPRNDLGLSLSQGHIGLVTQLSETLGAVVPSKTYGIMAAGRPVLYIGPAAGTPARIIYSRHCGWHIEPGDVAGAVDLLDQLARNPELVRVAGAHARQAFDESYDRPAGVARVASALGLRKEIS